MNERINSFDQGYGEVTPVTPQKQRTHFVDRSWGKHVDLVQSFYNDKGANRRAMRGDEWNDPIPHETKYQGFPDEEPHVGQGSHAWEDVRGLLHEWKTGSELKERERGAPLTDRDYADAAGEADRYLQSMEKDIDRHGWD